MSTTITLTFPDPPAWWPKVNETYLAMKYLREALHAHKDACNTYSGRLVEMVHEGAQTYTHDSVTHEMTVGAIVFPEVVS